MLSAESIERARFAAQSVALLGVFFLCGVEPVAACELRSSIEVMEDIYDAAASGDGARVRELAEELIVVSASEFRGRE